MLYTQRCIFPFLQLSKLCYCMYAYALRVSDLPKCHGITEEFVACVRASEPEILHRVKEDLLLHLPDNLVQFGANCNTERHVLHY